MREKAKQEKQRWKGSLSPSPLPPSLATLLTPPYSPQSVSWIRLNACCQRFFIIFSMECPAVESASSCHRYQLGSWYSPQVLVCGTSLRTRNGPPRFSRKLWHINQHRDTTPEIRYRPGTELFRVSSPSLTHAHITGFLPVLNSTIFGHPLWPP